MHAPVLHRRHLVLAAFVFLTVTQFVAASDEPDLNKEQIEQFLLHAKVVGSRRTSKGITSPWRLTLTDGTLTHDAAFQDIEYRRDKMQLANGRLELNFVDSYKYDIAAYRVAELLGLDDIVPVTVERSWQGNTGALSWWLPVMMDEVDRHKKKLTPPNADAWNHQMYKIRVLDQLVYDTDANLTNVLIGHNWKLWRVDFTRAFRRSKDVQHLDDLVQCDRQLFDKLKTLDENELAIRTKGYLNKEEVKALMARRDKIVAYFEKLISQKGESEVLY
jgi:hypothetical protein